MSESGARVAWRSSTSALARLVVCWTASSGVGIASEARWGTGGGGGGAACTRGSTESGSMEPAELLVAVEPDVNGPHVELIGTGNSRCLSGLKANDLRGLAPCASTEIAHFRNCGLQPRVVPVSPGWWEVPVRADLRRYRRRVARSVSSECLGAPVFSARLLQSWRCNTSCGAFVPRHLSFGFRINDRGRLFRPPPPIAGPHPSSSCPIPNAARMEWLFLLLVDVQLPLGTV